MIYFDLICKIFELITNDAISLDCNLFCSKLNVMFLINKNPVRARARGTYIICLYCKYPSLR